MGPSDAQPLPQQRLPAACDAAASADHRTPTPAPGTSESDQQAPAASKAPTMIMEPEKKNDDRAAAVAEDEAAAASESCCGGAGEMVAARRPAAAADESARERLKRHRTEMAGRVRIPDMWGQERLLKDWVDCAVFDRPLAATAGLLTARDALVAECASARRPAVVSHGPTATGRPLRVQNGCS